MADWQCQTTATVFSAVLSKLWAASPAGLELLHWSACSQQPHFVPLKSELFAWFSTIVFCITSPMASSWWLSVCLCLAKFYFICTTFLFLTFLTLVPVNFPFLQLFLTNQGTSGSCIVFGTFFHICQPIHICASKWVEKVGKMFRGTLHTRITKALLCTDFIHTLKWLCRGTLPLPLLSLVS